MVVDLSDEWVKRQNNAQQPLREHRVLAKVSTHWPFNLFFLLGYHVGHADGTTVEWARHELVKRFDALKVPPS